MVCRSSAVILGSHKFQTLLEAPAVLVAVRCWSPMWAKARTSLRVRSGSLSTLGAVNKLRSKTPGIAAIMRELALDCVEGAYSFQILEHLPGVHKEWADALSRKWQPDQVSNLPSELLQVTQCHLPPRVVGEALNEGSAAKYLSRGGPPLRSTSWRQPYPLLPIVRPQAFTPL